MITVGIVGLGLIGGSLAKAYQASGSAVVFGCDRDASVEEFARMSGVLNGILSREKLRTCDLILFAIPPRGVVRYLRDHAEDFTAHPMLIDCAGTKRAVCHAAFALAKEHGFLFLGGHPMAGSHNSGFRYSRADLFSGAPMVLVPPVYDDIRMLDRAKALLSPAGFGQITVTTAEEHDRIIAFTSQLAHVVSNAYIQSPTAGAHKGFSAGSYRDLTRVAWLDADMWTELFLENSDCLIDELDTLIANLQYVRRTVAAGDADALRAHLLRGKQRKEEVDGR